MRQRKLQLFHGVTMIVLNFPDGVSRIVPMGTRESFSVIAMRIFRRMIKADSWLFIVEKVPNHTCRDSP